MTTPSLLDTARPSIVVEAEHTLRDYRRNVAKYWGIAAGGLMLVTVPLAGPLAPFVVLSLGFWPSLAAAALAVHPVGRRADRARTVLKKWTELQTEGALAREVQPPDPRLDVAARMVERVLAHPSTPREAAEVVSRTERHLRSAVADLSTIGIRRRLEGPTTAISDVEANLELRIARMLSALGELHQSVVGQDLTEVQVHLSQLRDLVDLARAAADVEELLNPGTKERDE